MPLTKQEILDSVWADTAVTENTLTQRIKEIREALGDSAHEPSYVRTIPRVGFQFVAEVVEVQPTTEAPTPVRDDEARNVGPDPAPADAFNRSGSASPPIGSRVRPRAAAPIAIVSLAVLAVAAALLYGTRRAAVVPADGTANRRVMLAILPFENLSGDAEQQFFSDGLTEELIAELGRLDPDGLGVIARTSAMTYRETTKTVAQIATELGVDYVVEGSVRREGERVRIVAQLIRSSDQTHVWAERYDRDVRSILSLQADVARAIAQQMRISLSVAAATRGPSTDVHPDAYQAYLKGRFFLNQRTGDAIEKALQQFQQAIGIDPAYARAHAGLADGYELSASYASRVPRETIERAMASAARALELDPELAEAHTSLGTLNASYTWDWAKSEKSYLRALALNPSSAAAHKSYGELLSFRGRHDEAIAELTRAVELDPVSLLMHANLGIVHWRARRYDEAMRQMQQTLSMDPHYMLGYLNTGLIHAARGSYDEAAEAFRRVAEYAPDFADTFGLLGYVYGRGGRTAEARRVSSDLQRLSSKRYVSGYIRALCHLGLGERQQALGELERAYEERSWQVAMLKVDPLFDELRSETRFQSLLQQLKLTQ